MKKATLFLFAFAILSLFITSCNKDEDFSQTEDTEEITNTISEMRLRTCGHAAHMDKLLDDPEYKRLHEMKLEKVAKMSNSRALCSSPVILPIAVHFQGVSNPNASCLIALAESQIAILNQDYQGSNSDINNWTGVNSYFPGVSNGEACIGFQLATQNHPSGFGLSNGDKAVTINKTSGDQSNAWSGYINIFVKPNTGVLGYSPLGGSGNGDGVVVDANAFGAGSGCGNISPNAPYNLGRTLTHELGHYLLLDHIWGNGGCNSDDLVADTPPQAGENYGCPSIGITSCSTNDMFMNYMDYTDDACMVMFSAGQATRMENFVNSSLQNVVNNASNVLGSGGGGGGGTTPTCSDGIQNGNETGVDCGGSCAPCQTTGCSTPTNIESEILTTTKAKLTWDAIPNANKYIIRYKKQGTSQWTTKSATSPSKTLTGLQANKTYQYRVRTICTGPNSPYSPIKTFVTTVGGGGGSSCTDFSLYLTLDDWGSETTWTLKKGNQLVSSGGPYQDGQSGTTISKDWCLEDGCYTFKIKDSYGDGICCWEGYGEYQIEGDDGTYIYSPGEFGYSETQQFCISNGAVTNPPVSAREGVRKQKPENYSSRAK